MVVDGSDGAQKFPLVTSFSISMSRTWSTTMCFSRAFSRSSSFNRLAPSTFVPLSRIRTEV